MRKLLVVALLFILSVTFVPTSNAQCPMCKTSVESSLKDGKNTKGKGLNKGILYLLSVPYLIVGAVGVAWYFNSKKKQII